MSKAFAQIKMFQIHLDLFTFLILLKGFGEAIFMPECEYVKDVGWLRLSIVPATWWDARLRCNIAGGILASPTTSAMMTSMKEVMTKHGMAQSTVYVDMHTSFPEGVFMSIDGIVLSKIEHKWAVGEPNNLVNDEHCVTMNARGELADVKCTNVNPYFCLKKNVTFIVNECYSTSPGYKLERRTNRCYKFHRGPASWYTALKTCAAEHAHLTVINSAKEAQVIKDIFAENPPDTLLGEDRNRVHSGFLSIDAKTMWKTIFGQSFSQAGYEKWAPGEPTKLKYGCLTRDALLSTIDRIGSPLPFICESTLN